MKRLLDECLPKCLKGSFPGHEISTVPKMGLAGPKNGKLLELVTQACDLFITADQNLSYQQNLVNHNIAAIMLVARRNRREDRLPPVSAVLTAILDLAHGEVLRIIPY